MCFVGMSASTVLKLIGKFGIDRFGIKTKRLADPEKLHHIQSPLPVLNPPDEGLLALQRICELLLCKPGAFTHLDELFQHEAVLVRMGGLFHLTASGGAGSYAAKNRLWVRFDIGRSVYPDGTPCDQLILRLVRVF